MHSPTGIHGCQEFLVSAVLLATSAWTLGCGGGGAGSVTPPPPSPSPISVNVTPSSGTVFLGGTLALSASVSNTTNTAVTWAINGLPGGSAQAGTISADGLYTAPIDLPSGGTVHVTATSQADSSKSATVSVTVASHISMSLSQNSANVELGATQPFHAVIQSQGHPDPSVRWTLSGAACPTACGSVDADGNYLAPQTLPGSPALTLTATSIADPSKQASATVTITSHFTLQLSAPSGVLPGTTASLVATLTPAPGSNPSSTLSWSLQGAGCTGTACGLLTVTTTQSAGSSAATNTAVYTAPNIVPQPNSVVITVVPQADPSKQTQAVITIQAGSSISLIPPNATLAANHRVTLTAALGGLSGGSITGSVNSIAGGNSSVGQICATGSTPCQPYSTGTFTQVDYLAPGAIPSPNPVSITASSTANPSLAASSLIIQSFSASVLGTSNQNVTWQLQGSACGTPGICGSINSAGTYTAPSGAPNPALLQVVAISQDDPTQSGFASVTILNSLNILTIHPASIYAGGTNGFTLQVNGSGFVSTNPGPGSTLLIAGTSRITTCPSVNACSAPITSGDVSQPGNLAVQVQNPDHTVSNIAQMIVVAPATAVDTILLSSSAPSASGKDITVVEPTTAGIDTPDYDLDLSVAAIGTFSASTNTCNLAGNPISLTRPSTGASASDICLFSQAGFDSSMTYIVSGPRDIAVISKQPAGLGIIHLTLQIPATAAPGGRTLFVQNANLDQTAASGVLEVQ